MWLTKFKDLWGLDDPLQWHRYLFCNGVSSARLCNDVPSAHLCNSVAMLAHHLASEIVDRDCIRALMVGRLNALDKCLGVHLIGVEKALQRILCKVVALVTWADLEDLCVVVWLCPGLQTGMEEAFHAVCELFDLYSDDNWGLLIVDARYTVDSVDHVAALWNARVLWLCCSCFLFNFYWQ